MELVTEIFETLWFKFFYVNGTTATSKRVKLSIRSRCVSKCYFYSWEDVDVEMR